jgi:hypothetical protein
MKRMRTSEGEDPQDARVRDLPTTVEPSEKRQRLAAAEEAEEVTGAKWNLLVGLPYVVLSRLLDFLSTGSASSAVVAEGPMRGVPEPLRVRAEGARRQPVYKPGRRVPADKKDEYMRKYKAQDRRLRATRP